MTKILSDGIAAIIEEGCEFEGKLCFYGTVRISGLFRGQIYTSDTLIVSEKGSIEGTVDAGVVIIAGQVLGTVRAKYRVEIYRPAIFKGNIITNSLRVEDGVLFEGSSKMLSQDETFMHVIR